MSVTPDLIVILEVLPYSELVSQVRGFWLGPWLNEEASDWQATLQAGSGSSLTGRSKLEAGAAGQGQGPCISTLPCLRPDATPCSVPMHGTIGAVRYHEPIANLLQMLARADCIEVPATDLGPPCCSGWTR